jgi:hypothetical protein
MDNIKEQFEKLERLENKAVLVDTDYGYEAWSQMLVVSDGDYVRYDDVMALVNELIASSKQEPKQ